MSSTPFWQKTTFAPEALILVTISFSMLSSWSRKAFIWFGSRMRISALISVFFISNAESKRAIFAFSFFLGIPGWMTKKKENAKIALLDSALEIEKTEMSA